jgi:hypothetical protein
VVDPAVADVRDGLDESAGLVAQLGAQGGVLNVAIELPRSPPT